MSKFTEILISALLPAIKEVGKLELIAVLQKVEETEKPADFRADIVGTYTLFKRLESVAEKTKTKIDDGLIAAVLDAVEQVADDAGIQLPEIQP